MSLKRIINRTPRLKVLLKALKALEASELKIYNIFWVALKQYFINNLIIK